MRTSTLRFGAGLALPVLVAVAQAGEVALDKVPKPVLDAVQARFADTKVTGAGKEKTEAGNEVYEISLEDKDYRNIDVTVTPEGAIVLIEQEITRKDLPEPVAKTLESKYPKAKYRIVEKLIEATEKEEKLTSYEVLLITTQKQIRAVQLDLEGKILKEEKKTSEEEED